MTNSERIRSFNDEELAWLLNRWETETETGNIDIGRFFCPDGECDRERQCWERTKRWLGEEVDEREYLSLLKSFYAQSSL